MITNISTPHGDPNLDVRAKAAALAVYRYEKKFVATSQKALAGYEKETRQFKRLISTNVADLKKVQKSDIDKAHQQLKALRGLLDNSKKILDSNLFNVRNIMTSIIELRALIKQSLMYNFARTTNASKKL